MIYEMPLKLWDFEAKLINNQKTSTLVLWFSTLPSHVFLFFPLSISLSSNPVSRDKTILTFSFRRKIRLIFWRHIPWDSHNPLLAGNSRDCSDIARGYLPFLGPFRANSGGLIHWVLGLAAVLFMWLCSLTSHWCAKVTRALESKSFAP